MPQEYIIDEASAQSQLDLFCDWYDVDFAELEEALADSDDKSHAVSFVTKKLIKAIRRGSIEIQERELADGEPTLVVVQTLRRPLKKPEISEITYHEVTGKIRASVKVTKDMNHRAETYQLLALLSKEDIKVFFRLRGSDLGLLDSLGFLFLQT